MSDQTGSLLEKAKRGDLRAFAKLLTALERQGPASFGQWPELLSPAKPAFRLGITGPPGAGKSTLIGRLIEQFRAQGLRVGVIAVDPSSPFSKGAVLGDRIRYSEHFRDPEVFIRSLGSRGSLGGLSSAAYLMVRAFDLAGFDIVLLETVGVGQTELEIMNVADWVSVVLVPESGDSIQAMKAGLLEIADLFVVNKSDRPGADGFARELEASLALGESLGASSPKSVIKTSAASGDGLDAFVSAVNAEMSRKDANAWRVRRGSPKRLQSEARALLREIAEREIETRTEAVVDANGFLDLFDT